MSTISYEDFSKLEVKIGTITAVEVVADADRLLKLTVDVGEETPRQIVSGIREYFDDIQSLVGRQSPFLTNLESRTIRGLESQGMILAIGEGDVFSLLQPNVPVPSGSHIK